jgi:hypothetical protein
MIENIDDEPTAEERWRRKARRLRREVEAMAAELEAARTKTADRDRLRDQLRAVRAELEVVKRDWRPVPMKHPWQPRDPQCVLCQEPRDAPRHQVDS